MTRGSNDSSELVLSASHVYKKFCRSLRRSMYYGTLDVARGLIGRRPDSSGLRKSEFWAVQDVSLELRRGQALGIIGVNGSGKTTLLRLLAGIIPPDSGEIVSRGRTGALISLGAGFHPHMSGRENIYLNGILLGMSRREIDSKLGGIIGFSELEDFIDSPVSTYSSGMRVRLGFSIAISINPEILILDEVLAVGDHVFRAKCFNEIDRLRERTCIVLVSHQLRKIARICNRIIVMDRGSLIHQSEDVQTGIQFYCSLCGVESSSGVSGTGEARIHSVELRSGRNTATAEGTFCIDYMDDLIVDLLFSLNPGIDRPVMSLTIHDIEHTPLVSCQSNQCEFTITNKSDRQGVRIIFPALQLSPGLYTITPTIHSADSESILARHQAVCSFRVAGRFNSPSPFHLRAQWSDL